jgi:hypothetical protein
VGEAVNSSQLSSWKNKKGMVPIFEFPSQYKVVKCYNGFMNLLREIVGGKKNRLKEGEFNLDLTYITPRMIAMAFPA